MGTPDDLAMPFLLASAFRGLVEAVHADLAGAGHPGVQARHGFAMQAIGTGCTSVELGQRLGVSKQAATKTARALEDLGLIERTRDTRDQRALVLTPTPRGHDMMRLSAESFRRQLTAWRERSGDRGVEITLRTLAQADPGSRGLLDISTWG